MIKQIGLVVMLLLWVWPAQAVHLEQDPDYSLYDNVLQSYVSADGLVDYRGIRANSQADLQSVLEAFAKIDLSDMDYEEKLAFWINAYNANLLQLILNYPDMKKIDEHPEMFDLALPIAKGNYSLNDIAYRIIHGKANPTTGAGPIKDVTLEIFDPRIHFALSAGTVGGAPLQNFAYNSENIEAALRKNSSHFVNSPQHLRIVDGRLVISGLMNQYAEDFDRWGGSASYLTRTLDPAQRDDVEDLKRLLATDYRKAEFTYDVSVNDIRHAATKRPKLMRAAK